MDIDFLKKYMPHSEMQVIKRNLPAYTQELERVERQIKAMPRDSQIVTLPPDQIKIGMHYFGGATDIWVYALGNDDFAEAFVCLNGDAENAECGPVYIPEFLRIPIINIDLHWNSDITLKEVMEKVKGKIVG